MPDFLLISERDIRPRTLKTEDEKPGVGLMQERQIMRNNRVAACFAMTCMEEHRKPVQSRLGDGQP